MNKTETKGHLTKTMQLVSKTLYKTIEFQLLFKLFYVGIILFVTNFFISTFFDTTNILVTKIQLDEVLERTPIVSLFEFEVIFTLLVSLFVIIFVYLVEKNGVIIITSKYYRNNYIGFFKTLLLSVRKTPIFIFRRLYEMRLGIFIFIGLYIVWKVIILLTPPQWFMLTFATVLIIYGTSIFLSILFSYTFTAYITCLESTDSTKEFNDQMPHKLLYKRFYTVVIFYIIFVFVMLLWLLLFYGITQLLLHFSTTYPTSISTILPFFIAFTIISILIVLSLLKTIKISLTTILYYQERNRQNKDTFTSVTTKQPRLSNNIHLAFLAIFVIAFIGGTIITSSIKPKTTHVINNANNYIEQIKKEQLLFNSIQSTDINIPKFVKKTLVNRGSAMDVIEKVIFTYLAYITSK